MDIKEILRKTFSVNWFKSFWFNAYYFGLFKAFKFPILLGYNVKIANKGNRHSVKAPIRFASVCFGLKYDPFSLGSSNSYWFVSEGAMVNFKGSFKVAKGVTLHLFPEAIFSVGDGFTSNANLLINCMKSIEIGDDCLFGWNITLMDSDGGHQVLDAVNKSVINSTSPIKIGNHVWVGAEVSILKGSDIPDDCIIGFKSNVCGLIAKNKSAIAGNPAKIIKDNVNWRG